MIPRHIHLRQEETFDVEQGVLGVEKNGVEFAITKDDGPVSISPGVRSVSAQIRPAPTHMD